MAPSVIAYDKDLPEVAGRLPWTPPTSHLVKDETAHTGWREESGRRPSKLLLVPKIRAAVDAWRESGYAGASEVTQRLFTYWFDEDHDVTGFGGSFRYYFCQREAIETLVWLVEVANQGDAKRLVDAYGTVYQRDLASQNVSFETTREGTRRLRRFVPELEAQGVQELPPAGLRRFAFKMATGSGKTWVMAMAVIWSRLHKLVVPGSTLSTNFLIVAPNVIVFQRLQRDFESNRLFRELPLVPPEWKRHFAQNVILRGDAMEPGATSNLFLTNVQQLYEAREQAWTPTNAVDAVLGRPAKDLGTSAGRTMLERLKMLPDLVVINDEAHHVHQKDLAWSKSLLAIDEALPNGIGAWLDFSATPKDQNGMYFPWTVVDYPLAQAVEDRIVKAPLIVTKEGDKNQPQDDPDNITKENVAEKYSYWLQAAVKRWKKHRTEYKKLGVRPVLFIMAEKNVFADALGEYLWKTPAFRLKRSEVLVIHTDGEGEVRKSDLEAARAAARDIDDAKSAIKVIVSVMMLREGWDVRNVSVVLGLRPFTAKAEILPEQVIGRGLRLMKDVTPDRTQTLEVLGTHNLLRILREQLEAEGVGVASTDGNPPAAVVIEPVRERSDYDITLPITKPSLERNARRLADLDVRSLEAIYEQEDLSESFRFSLKMEFAPTPVTEVSQEDIAGEERPAQEVIADITNKVMQRTGLSNRFAELYPIVKEYVAQRCFGAAVNVDESRIRSHLSRLEIREGVAKYLARKIGELTVETRKIEFENAAFQLSETKPFHWRRNLPPPLRAEKTVFNYVATYNNFERQFAEFLDRAPDILRFAALGTTEQGASGTTFRVDYLKPSGAIGFYHPDWVAVQQEMNGQIINWVIETKGRVWEGTEEKDAAMHDWCESVARATGESWKYIRVNQAEFRDDFPTFRVLVFTVVGNAMTRKREASGVTVTTEEILQWRDEGRRWQ